ncbi:retrovirus-related pol polyprotein from transposon TNT 1-94 [Tanacetum coccineum]
MRPFGCPVTILNTLDPLGKFDGKADEGFLVGYSINSKAFRVFNTRTRKVEENLHINFLENKPNVAGSGQAGQEKASDHEYILLPLMLSNSPLSSSSQSTDNKDADEKEGYANNTNRVSTINPCISTAGQGFDNADDQERIDSSTQDVNTAGPTTGIFDDAYYDTEEVGAEVDLNNLEKNIDKQESERVIVVETSKKGCTRLCPDEGIDYDEVFAHVARIEAIRLFLAYASFMGLIVYQIDVKSAFLYGTIEEEVYVCQPPSFEDPQFLDKVYKMMHKRFQMSSMGELTFFLGLQVQQKEDGIFISQDKYVADILKKFDFVTVKAASTPIETQRLIRMKKLRMWMTIVANSTTEADYVAAANCFGQHIEVGGHGNTDTIDGKVKVVSEASIRRHLKLEDSDGISTLPTLEIFSKISSNGPDISTANVSVSTAGEEVSTASLEVKMLAERFSVFRRSAAKRKIKAKLLG